MADQALREALEKLASEWRYSSEDLTPWQEGGGPSPDEAAFDDASVKLRELLAAHPVEPAPKRLSESLDEWPDVEGSFDEVLEGAAQRGMRQLSAPAPVGVDCEITDEAVEAAARVDRAGRVGYDDWETAPVFAHQALTKNARAMLEAARPFMTSRPALDRDKVGEVLISYGVEVRTDEASPPEMFGRAVDAVLALAVPVPTREAIAEVIATKVMRYDSAADVRLVEDGDVEALDAGTAAVLALLNGSAK